MNQNDLIISFSFFKMLFNIFLFVSAMHGLCDAIILYHFPKILFLEYVLLSSFLFTVIKNYPYLKRILIAFLVIPGLEHFWVHDGFLLFFLIFSLLISCRKYWRSILYIYFILIHSFRAIPSCIMYSCKSIPWLLYAWWIVSIVITMYFSWNPHLIDVYLLSVTIPHILLEKDRWKGMKEDDDIFQEN